ncbi:hypothetical protein [Streptomyces sp. 6N223]|uniref:hypothetical protein n=1 Tax=Streptomyces sp. 6N223 TaxID=3457412 RepID=UPI003FD1FC72
MTNLRSHRLAATTVVAALAALTALTALTACGGSSEPEASVDELFQEYVDSTDVKNDPYGDYGTTREDRLAQFAAYGDPQQMFNRLLSTEPCSADYYEESACPDDLDYRRYVLVKHEDESLEVMPLYVLDRSVGADVLFDSTGESYEGGLDDFRENNDLLDAGDQLLAPRDITATDGSKVVVVSGHTSSALDAWRPWLIGASATAVAVGIGGLATFLAVSRRSGAARASDSTS